MCTSRLRRATPRATEASEITDREDIFIGLMQCYLLLGLIGSSLQEAVAGWLNLRGRCLSQGMKDLLAHAADGGKRADALFRRVTGHSLIQPAADGRSPSYISAANFATALVDGLLDGSQAPLFSQVEANVATLPAGPAKQTLTALLVRSAGDLDSFRADVERWFDDAMDRVSGANKRRAHNGMLLFGIAVALLANLDSIAIARQLARDPVALTSVVTAASRITTPAPAYRAGTPPSDTATGPAGTAASAAPLSSAKNAAAQLAGLGLPLGWTKDQFAALTQPLALVAKLLGLLVTALAVSLGAPFWFDALQLFLNIRTAGHKPLRSDADT